MNIHKQYMFIKMMNELFKKGYTLKETFLLMNHFENRLVTHMMYLLEEGASLSEILKYLKFKRFVVEMMLVGEKSNKINEVIALIEKYFDFYLTIHNQINKVLVYPLLLLVASLITFEFIKVNLIPALNLFSENLSNDPFLVFITFNMLKIIFILCMFITIILVVFKPLTNLIPSVKMYRSLYVSNNLYVLLSCGNSLDESINILKSSLNESLFKLNVLSKLMFEENISVIFNPYDQSFIKFFKIGLGSNHLVQMLSDYNEIYFNILVSRMKKITYYIQFILFLVLGINIFLVYYCILTPMLNLSNHL